MTTRHRKAPEGATAPHYEYPEHEKLKALGGANQHVGDFLEWLGERGLLIAEYPKGRDDLMPSRLSRNDLIAQHFGIDMSKLEAEKQAMLNKLRAA